MVTELKYCIVDEKGVVRNKEKTTDIPNNISLQEILFNGLNKNPNRIVFVSF